MPLARLSAPAAGWRSYSVGQGKRLREQPDYPMLDTGFLLRFLMDRELRRLGRTTRRC